VKETDMQRRKFLEMMGGAGLAAGLPWWAGGASAGEPRAPFEGPYYLNIVAHGGMDQSSWGDPRNDPAMNVYPDGATAGRVGNLWYAPMGRNREIFEKYHDRMLVFNGLEVTGGHSSGRRWQTTGRKASGYPSLGSLYATCVGQGLSIPWLLTAKYGQATGGLTPYSRIGGDALKQLGAPNRYDVNIGHQREAVVAAVQRYRIERLEALRAQQGHLPFARRNLDNLQQARVGTEMLDRIQAALPETIESPAHQAMVQFAAGVTAVATIDGPGNWDTHGEHPIRTNLLCSGLADIIDQAWKWAEHFGIDDRLVIHISSDVGRSPTFNARGGKDHHAYGTATLMMKNAPWGNRVVGISGPRHQGVRIDPATLQANPDGVRLEPSHIHRALRQLLGIDQHPLALKLPFDTPEVDVLNPANTSPVLPG
jgi:uncharacterized protein (DUF1501 family)